VILDQAGNLYGTTMAGGGLACGWHGGCGTIFALTPSRSGWVEYVLYSFQGGDDGYFPWGGLTLDQSGTVLFGTASTGGASGGGTVFAFSPIFTLVYSFQAVGAFGPVGPVASLTLDAAGNLYGATREDATGIGSVFKLTPPGDGWQFTSYDFEGGYPIQSNVILDADGNLYGTANGGVCYPPGSCGTVWKITP
jgi:uncharacterized repeat protein (TIGR03803 family)